MKLNHIYHVLAGVALLATGVTLGRLSKTELNTQPVVLAKSTNTTSFAVKSAKGERIPIHVEGTDVTAFDYVVTIPSENNKTFSFYMGFTR